MDNEYELIKNSFLSKRRDYKLFAINEEEIDEVIKQNLKTAIVLCEFEDVEFDDLLDTFNRKITGLEIEAITSYMVYNWILPKVNSVELFEYRLSSTDYKRFSEANHLESMQKIKNDSYSTARYYANKIARKKMMKELISE